MTTKGKRAIGYVRVSTFEQTAGYGLDIQQRVIEQHAKAAGLRLVGVVRDEARSGTKDEDLRPGLAEVMTRLESGEAKVLVVPKLDRLARKLILQERIVADIRKAGGEVVSVAEPDIDGEDGQRVLIRQLLGAIGEYEAWLIRKRLQAGREAKAAAGGRAVGAPPFGWAAGGKGRLVEVPAEQAALKLMRSMRQAGSSLRQIVAALEAGRFPTKLGRRWNPNTVRRILAA